MALSKSRGLWYI